MPEQVLQLHFRKWIAGVQLHKVPGKTLRYGLLLVEGAQNRTSCKNKNGFVGAAAESQVGKRDPDWMLGFLTVEL
ncbi:hypothetical protein ASE11_24910 [Hydrogenophaga sp. Root209]|nr:hypothetical protein ASE11_24910 [Hydrogenophaga sp. Root209]